MALRTALAAVRAGDTLVVTKLDRLARSLRDATDIADELTKKGVALNLGERSTIRRTPWAGSCSTGLLQVWLTPNR
ncbi:recombinase family protein [Sphingomonas sp. LR61]|uniref:recombinase family protein n=1 Tax=Sphingomonas sp. LR61 TaxID=3050234 RepID=UPI003FA71B97